MNENTLKQIDVMLYYIKDTDDRTLLRCYVYRRVLHWTPREVAERFGYSPVTVNSYAQRAAIVFDLKNDRTSIYGKVLSACEDCVKLHQLKQQRDELTRVTNRVNNKIRKTLKYKVNFNEYKPGEPKNIRTEVDLSSNNKEEVLNYISDVCSERGFGKPNFEKVGRSLYIWNIDSRHDFTINFKYTGE